MPKLSAYKGNKTHGHSGIHLGYWDKSAERLVILCGAVTANVLKCRCTPWWPVPDTKITCKACFDMGKAMHDATER